MSASLIPRCSLCRGHGHRGVASTPCTLPTEKKSSTPRAGPDRDGPVPVKRYPYPPARGSHRIAVARGVVFRNIKRASCA